MPIKITSEDAKKGDRIYPKIRDKHWADILRIHFIDIVEDTFVIYHNADKMNPELENKWRHFRQILEKRL